MEIAVQGKHHVAVSAAVNNEWVGTIAFTNVVLAEGPCSEGAGSFILCNFII